MRDLFGDEILIPRTAQDELTGNKSFEKHLLSTMSAFMWVYYAVFSLHNLLMILCEFAHAMMELGVAIVIALVVVTGESVSSKFSLLFQYFYILSYV